MSTLNLYTSQTPTTANSNSPAGNRTLGMNFQVTANCTSTGARWFASTSLPTTYASMSLWSVASATANTGTMLSQKSFTLGSMVAGAWNSLTWTSGVSLTTGNVYVVQIESSDNYCFSSSGWPKTNGILSGLDGTNTGGNGRFNNGAAAGVLAQFQNGSTGFDFFADITVDTGGFTAATSSFMPFFS